MKYYENSEENYGKIMLKKKKQQKKKQMKCYTCNIL